MSSSTREKIRNAAFRIRDDSCVQKTSNARGVKSTKKLFANWRLFLLGSMLATAMAAAQELWLAPNINGDFVEAFSAAEPWPSEASRIGVIKLYASWVIRAGQDQFNAVVQGIVARHLRIALETGTLNVASDPHPTCGGWGLVEGYGTVAQAKLLSNKLRQAGGRIDFIAMDEPLWYGHFFKHDAGKQPGCLSDVKEVVSQMRPIYLAYKEAFPDVTFGDIEPTNMANSPEWKQAMTQFVWDFREQMREPLDFIHLDIPFEQSNATRSLQEFFSYVVALKESGIVRRVGIIYNGLPSDKDDASWVRSARAHVDLIEGSLRFRPDDAIFQSWNEYPQNVLPRHSRDTLLELERYYVSRRSQDAH